MEEIRSEEEKAVPSSDEDLTTNPESEQLSDEELESVDGGTGNTREPTKHPAKVTVPDIKLAVGY